jgi:hypothetical protein
MSRWKCTAVIDNQALIFKRYAETPGNSKIYKTLTNIIIERKSKKYYTGYREGMRFPTHKKLKNQWDN